MNTKANEAGTGDGNDGNDGSDGSTFVAGRLVLDDRVVSGRIEVIGDRIAAVEIDPIDDRPSAEGMSRTHGPARSGDHPATAKREAEPYIAPGFVDVHVHGWGGHDAMGDDAALDGMARSLLGRGVTSFLPTAVTAPLAELAAFADRVRAWRLVAPPDGAEPLGFNLEGPFLAPERRGAHDARHLRVPADVLSSELEHLLPDLRLVTIAPELAGATDLIHWLSGHGVATSLGHSAASVAEAGAGYAAGATSTTHLFNAMSGIDHRAPGLALTALLDDAVSVELIADGVHVDRALWPLILRLKPPERWLLVSDAIAPAGTGDGRGRIGGLDCEIVGSRATLAGTSILAGSVIALDQAVRNVVETGTPLAAAVAAASRNPLAVIGVTDRGRIAVGQRADLVELDDRLRVCRVMRGGMWFDGEAA